MLHGHLIAATADVHSHLVIFKLSVGLRLSGELSYTSCQSEVVGDVSGPDGPSEALGAIYVDPAAAGSVSVQPLSVCSVPVDQALNKD